MTVPGTGLVLHDDCDAAERRVVLALALLAVAMADIVCVLLIELPTCIKEKKTNKKKD